MQAHKLQAFFRTVAPVAGWDLYQLHAAGGAPPTHAHCRLAVATHTLCSAAASGALAPLGGDVHPTWTSLNTITEPLPDAPRALPVLAAQLLACCVHTVSITLASWPPASASPAAVPEAVQKVSAAALQGAAAEAAQKQAAGWGGGRDVQAGGGLGGVLQPWLDAIDSHIGDIIALLPDAAVQQDPYGELAAAAAHHVATVTAAAAGPEATAVCRSARRVWAAFIRDTDGAASAPAGSPTQSESSSHTSHDADSGEEESPHETGAGKGGGSSVVAEVGSVQDPDTVCAGPGEGQVAGLQRPGQASKKTSAAAAAGESCPEELSSEESSDDSSADETSSADNAAGDRGSGPRAAGGGKRGRAPDGQAAPPANVKVAVAALQALRTVASSDAAMAVLFDEAAIAARFALPDSVVELPLPLESVAMIGKVEGAFSASGDDAEGAAAPRADTRTAGAASTGTGAGGKGDESTVRMELLLLVEVCAPQRELPSSTYLQTVHIVKLLGPALPCQPLRSPMPLVAVKF